MKKKKNQMKALPCESLKEQDGFARLFDSMRTTKAWEKLTISQIGLYMLFKFKLTKHRDGTYNTDNMALPKKEWSKYYSDKRYFDRDMDALIELGFARVILYQGNLRKPTIYGLSEMWKHYGTDKFKITDKDRRPKDTLTEDHRKAISKKTKENNAKRYKTKNKK